MHSYQVVIREFKKNSKTEIIDRYEFYVSDNIDSVYMEAVKSAQIVDGEIIAIIKKDPIIAIFKKD